MQLEQQLKRAERNEKLVARIVIAALVISVAAFIPTAAKLFGGADPYDDDATILSVGLGLVYIPAAITFWVGLASYFSRFRAGTQRAKEKLMFESIRELRQEVQELRRIVDPPGDQRQE